MASCCTSPKLVPTRHWAHGLRLHRGGKLPKLEEFKECPGLPDALRMGIEAPGKEQAMVLSSHFCPATSFLPSPPSQESPKDDPFCIPIPLSGLVIISLGSREV